MNPYDTFANFRINSLKPKSDDEYLNELIDVGLNPSSNTNIPIKELYKSKLKEFIVEGLASGLQKPDITAIFEKFHTLTDISFAIRSACENLPSAITTTTTTTITTSTTPPPSSLVKDDGILNSFESSFEIISSPLSDSADSPKEEDSIPSPTPSNSINDESNQSILEDCQLDDHCSYHVMGSNQLSQQNLGEISACVHIAFAALHHCLQTTTGLTPPFGCSIDEILSEGSKYTQIAHQDLVEVMNSRKDLMKDLHLVTLFPLHLFFSSLSCLVWRND